MKNKLLICICTVLLFIPSVAAIIVYEPPSAPLVGSTADIDSLLVTSPSGREYTVSAEDEIKTITSLLNGKSEKLPEKVLSYKTFTFTINGGGRSDIYKVYASCDDLDGIYYEYDGKQYKADTSFGEKFLSLSFCSELYDISYPTLKVGTSQVEIAPKQMEWKYRLVDGEYANAEVVTAEQAQNGGDGEGELDIVFSRTPDNAIITVSKDGEEVKRTVLDESFTGVETDDDAVFNIRIEASWLTANEHSGGSAVYEFDMNVQGKPTFNLYSYDVHAGKITCEQGGILVLSAKNANTDKISLEISPSTFTQGFKPTFYGQGEVRYALIPTDYTTGVSDLYEVKVVYNKKTYTFPVSITERGSGTGEKVYTSKASTIEKYINEQSLAELKKLLSDISLLQSEGEYIGSEKFVFPGGVSSHRTGYGITMSFKNAEGYSFNHCGIDVKLRNGRDVTAASDGVVVFVGEDTILGGMVVVDHGLGVRSLYARVSTDKVKAGDTIKQGDVIGEADESGFGDDERVHYSVMVGSEFVSPLLLIEKGFDFPQVK